MPKTRKIERRFVSLTLAAAFMLVGPPAALAQSPSPPRSDTV